jgi:hypothetical protein
MRSSTPLDYLTLSEAYRPVTKSPESSNSPRSASESSGFRDSLISCVKNAHLAGIQRSRSTRELVSSGFRREFLEISLCLHVGRWT